MSRPCRWSRPIRRGAGKTHRRSPLREAHRAIQQTIHEPFEPDRRFDELATKPGGETINDATADDRLADSAVPTPGGTIGEEIGDGGGEEMIGVHEARRARHDAVTIGVGVVGEGDVEFVAQGRSAAPWRRGRTVHPNLTVPIQSHKRNVGSTASLTTVAARS